MASSADLPSSFPTRGSATPRPSSALARTAAIVIPAGAAEKPFPTYPGSKDAGGVAETIVGLFPPHCCYIEPFLGNGAVMRKKRPALRSIGIDRDRRVIDAWERIQFPGVELHCRCGISWLKGPGAKSLPADALVYIDAPYLLRTRKHRRLYRYELTIAQHVELLDAARALPCTVFISHYDDPLYHEKLDGWAHSSFPAMTRGGPRVEHLWWRSTLASFGGDPRYAGRDFRERERIKRKAQRWAKKFRALPEAERAAVLAAVLDAGGIVEPDEARGIRSSAW